MTGAGPAGAASPGLRWLILGCFVGAIFFAGLGGGIAAASDGGNDSLAMIGSIITFISMPLLVTYAISVFVWIHKSWSMLPYEQRVTDGGVRVTPGSAVGFLFIPFYNLYWYFIISVGLCSAYNRVLASYGSTKRASTGLATTAAILQVIPYVNFIFAPFLWLVFMFNVESAKLEYERVARTA